MSTYTTAEITEGFTVSGRMTPVWLLTIWTDRPMNKSGLGKGKRAGTLTAPTLPELLRTAADLIEREGAGLIGLSEVLKGVGA